MKYKGIVISDIHVGAFDLQKLYTEYTEVFLNYIQRMERLDFLIITGDFFDHHFMLSDPGSVIAHAMMRDLITICKEKNTVIRIVYGTESHECGQYDVLSVLQMYDKIEIVKYAKEEELLPGLNVLYLPEEYLLDRDKYYEKYFSKIKHYDYVFGHGVIREVMKVAAVQMGNKEPEGNGKRKKVPVFTTAELNKICKGQVYFGHYHNMENIDDKIFSVGSFSRWEFGQEGEKGFFELKCNIEKGKYSQLFIENHLAEKYVTVAYGYDDKVFTSNENLMEALNRVDTLIKDKVIDHVRYIINVPTTVENPEAVINLVKERYKFNKNVKTDISHGYIVEKKKQEKEKIDSENEKFSFIFDKNLPVEEKTSRFISISYNKSIPSDTVSKILFLSLNEFLDEEKSNDE